MSLFYAALNRSHKTNLLLICDARQSRRTTIYLLSLWVACFFVSSVKVIALTFKNSTISKTYTLVLHSLFKLFNFKLNHICLCYELTRFRNRGKGKRNCSQRNFETIVSLLFLRFFKNSVILLCLVILFYQYILLFLVVSDYGIRFHRFLETTIKSPYRKRWKQSSFKMGEGSVIADVSIDKAE